ncbi:MAG: type II toxin-antitoxin system VapC family toxin [Deltaproteobacteria bacterium]|nr:type II toxin-antitoxin system VapC family toxin [Deltaproteobacteria bacterium]
MKYLLDTHVWLWTVLADARVSRAVRRTLAGLPAKQRVGIASISLKEAAWHLARGRVVVVGMPWPEWLRQAARAPQLEILPLTVEVAIASEAFGLGFPADPADRIIAATAKIGGLTLITADRPIRASGEVATLW